MRAPRLPFSIAAILLFACAALLEAQKPAISSSAPAAVAPDPYAAESFVIESFDSLFAMNADGTGYRQRTLRVKIQSEAALRQFGVLAIPFASASEHAEFEYARVLQPDGSIIETPPSDAIEQPEQVAVETSTAEMKLPQGWEAELPEAVLRGDNHPRKQQNRNGLAQGTG